MPPELIAHRGDRGRFLENTLASLTGALGAGARFVEFDVQLSADEIPVLMHDDRLHRLAGSEGRVVDQEFSRLEILRLSGPTITGERIEGEKIPSLEEAVAVLADKPGVFAFVELKGASLRRFGPARCLERMLPIVSRLGERWALISFDHEVLAMAKTAQRVPVGWVLDRRDEIARERAESLAPDYLFCDRRKLRFIRRPPWPGPWRWVVYAVNNARSALNWHQRGFEYVETDRIAELISDPRLNPGKEAGERRL